MKFPPRSPLLCAWMLATAVPAQARAEAVDVYAAGSLKGLVATLATRAAALGITINPLFGGSGDLHDRIDRGATPDLFLSADMAAPRALATRGRAQTPPIAFAGNRLCLVAPQTLGLTPATMLDRLLAPGVRIKTSKPIADPSGDYAMAMFALMDAAHPGAGAALRANAERQMAVTAPAAPGQNATAALFAAHRIDVAVTYCSASADLARSAPGLVSVAVPIAFDPRPVFGLVALSANPAALRVALLLLSKAGQADVAQAGLLPLSSNPR